MSMITELRLPIVFLTPGPWNMDILNSANGPVIQPPAVSGRRKNGYAVVTAWAATQPGLELGPLECSVL